MKKLLIFSLLLFTISQSFGQVQKLKEFSSGDFIDSRIVFEENGEDVFGYFLLYEFDRKSREIYDMEYVLLDKNLNKITSGIFTQGVFKHFMMKITPRLTFVKKVKNEIIFGLHDDTNNPAYLAGLDSDYFNQRYRRINLEDFEISKEFSLQESKMVENEYQIGDSFTLADLENNQSIYPTSSDKFVIFAPSEYKIPVVRFDGVDYSTKVKSSVKGFSVTDSNFNILWSKLINSDKEDVGIYSYKASDSTTLVMQKNILNKKVDEIFSFTIFDMASGRLIGEISEKDPNYKMTQFQLKFLKDKILVYNYLYEKRDKNYTDEKALGYAKLIFDKNTGQELKRDYVLWEDLNPHITFKGKFGDIPKYGKIIFQDFIPLKNGNTLGIAEGYKTARKSSILDFYLMEFDVNMKIKYFKKIEKTPNNADYNLSGRVLLRYGYFDFYYSQKLDDDDNYVIFYSNNEKEGNSLKRKKNPSWVLGIVTYVDGEFEIDKLQLTTEDGMITPVMAKNGSIILQQYSEKNGVELRLEKINY